MMNVWRGVKEKSLMEGKSHAPMLLARNQKLYFAFT